MKLRSSVVKVVILFFFVSLVLASLPQSPFIPEVKAESEGNITFQSNVIPFVNVQYASYSFTFSYKSFFLRVRPYFGLSNGSVWTLQTAITWLKARYPNVNLATLVQKLEMKINYGFNVTKIPTVIANNLEWIGFKLVDWNFPLSNFELETVEYVYPNETRINATRINIPKLGLTFSFEDLYPYGYTVQHVNQTWVLIGNIKGKTDLYLDPITYSSNTITVTGYTEASPASFDSLYTADTSGALELKASTAYSTNASYSLTQQVRPAESLALKVKLNVTAVSGSVNVRIVGVDLDSNALTTWLNFTTTGIKTTIGAWYKSVNTNGITVEVNTGESATFKIYQSRWGVVWKQATNQYAFDCKLVIGDGSTTTWFTDLEKQVIINHMGLTAGSTLIYVRTASTFRLGELVSESLKITRKGCKLFFAESTNWQYAIRDQSDTAVTLLYSTDVGSTVEQQFALKAGSRMWNVHMDFYTEISGNTANLYGLLMTGTYPLRPAGVTIDTITIRSTTAFMTTSGSSLSTTIKNLYGRTTYTGYGIYVGAGTATYYLVNWDINLWTFSGWVSTKTFYRQYEFDLNVTTVANAPISGANVTVKHYGQSVAQDFTVLTGTNGSFSTKTLSSGYYNQANGNTMQSYNPYRITITKAGYITHDRNFTQIEKKSWNIALLPLIFTNPVARFNNTITTVNPNQTITLDGSMSYDPDGGSITNYSWNFGDNATEIRYMDYEFDPILDMLVLGTMPSSENMKVNIKDYSNQMGIRAYKTDINGNVLAELSNGSPVAVVNDTLSAAISGLTLSTVWMPPKTNFGTTEKLMIEIWANGNVNPWTMFVPLITEGLSRELKAIEWTVYYKFGYNILGAYPTFQIGGITSNVSRLENFRYSNVTSGNYPVMNHTWSTAGNYTITLTVTDDESATDTFQWEIAVTPTVEATGITAMAPFFLLGMLIMIPIGVLIWKKH